MFICSVRASTVRFFGVIALTLALLFGTLLLGGGEAVAAAAGTDASYSFTGVRTEEDRHTFFRQFGIEVGDTPADERTFVLPGNFDRVLLGYNEVQRKIGLDLCRYSGKKVTRYTYEVKNAPEGMTVYAGIMVCRGRVVAADIASADPEGFVLPPTAFATLGEKT